MEENKYFNKKRCLVWVALAIFTTVIIMCSSCTRTVYVPITSVQRDSIFLHTHSRDSIMVHDSITIREKGDTVWMERWHTAYRDRLLTDTIYIERHDSINVPVPIEKPLSFSDRAWIKVGKLGVMASAMVLVVILGYIFRKKVLGY